MSSTDAGHKAEQAAALYLEMRGYKVLEQNWRRPRAEIDIVAKKDEAIYFVEVKYRSSKAQGSGLEYVTSSKLKRMQRGAELWVAEMEWPGPYQLAAIEVAGASYTVEHFIDNVF